MSAKLNHITPSALTSSILQDIKDANKLLNAFVTTTDDFALEKAAKSTERHKVGIKISDLDGIPIAVKDNFCTKDVPTTCASVYVSI